MHSPKIEIVIVNWNGKNDTLECLNSVRSIEYPNFNVVLVDNGSSDGSVAAIRDSYPAMTIIETGNNLGFAGGNNIGIRKAIEQGADYVFLLNNDTTVDAKILYALLDASQSINDKGIVGAKIFYHADPNLIWYAGARWDSRRMEFEHIGFGQYDSEEFRATTETEYICGCALFSHVEIFNRIGLLDERFFLIFEETDFCYRAKRNGYRCFLAPDAKVWHKISVSFGGANSPLYKYFITRNLLVWAEKNLSRSERFELYKRTLISFLRSILPPRPHFEKSHFNSTKNRLSFFSEYLCAVENKYTDPMIISKRRGILDYCLRRFGNCPDSLRRLGP